MGNIFEEFMMWIINRFGFIFLLPFFIFFVWILLIKLSQNKIVQKDALNKNAILLKSGVYTKIYFTLFSFIFSIFGVFLIYLSFEKSEYLFNSILGVIIGVIMCLIPIFLTLSILKEYYKISKGDYVIVVDKLMDKRYISNESASKSYWLLYFKDFFGKYNNFVKFHGMRKGDNCKEGEHFYLVFIKNDCVPYVFPEKEYLLEQCDNERLKKYEDIEDYVGIKKFVLKKEIIEEPVVLSKEKIINDYFDGRRRKSLLMDIFVILFITFCLVISFILSELLAIILVAIVWLFFVIMTFIKLKHFSSLINKIKAGEYTIKEDEVATLNEMIQYRDINELMSLKFKKYNKLVYVDKSKYSDVNVGQEFYLIFINGEKEPLVVYSKKNTLLEK